MVIVKMPLSRSKFKAKADQLERKIENMSFKDVASLALLNIARSVFKIFLDTEAPAGGLSDTSTQTVT